MSGQKTRKRCLTLQLTPVLPNCVRFVKSYHPRSEIHALSFKRRYTQSGTLMSSSRLFQDSSEISLENAAWAPFSSTKVSIREVKIPRASRPPSPAPRQHSSMTVDRDWPFCWQRLSISDLSSNATSGIFLFLYAEERSCSLISSIGLPLFKVVPFWIGGLFDAIVGGLIRGILDFLDFGAKPSKFIHSTTSL